jgi:cation:H+ antiporter
MIQFLLFIAGLGLLIFGADLLVRGASKLALSFGISPLVVGLTIVAFGTSAPEAAVSVSAVLDNNTGIALGNVVGSNILNVLLILGLSALIIPLVVNAQLIRQEVPIMIAASVLVVLMALDGTIAAWEGGLLFALLLGYTTFLVIQSRRENKATQEEFEAEIHPAAPDAWDARLPVQIALIIGGLVLLVSGSELLVGAAVHFAKLFGVSDTIIGLTIVAAGTSMPEAATSIAAAFKGERDIAVGNVVGSNTFNLLGCVGLSSMVAGDIGLTVASSLLAFDLWVMLAVAIACLPIFITGKEIARWEGGVFTAYYVAYVVYLIMAAQQHEALGTFSFAMLTFAVPLTVITLLVTLMRHRRDPGQVASD